MSKQVKAWCLRGPRGGLFAETTDTSRCRVWEHAMSPNVIQSKVPQPWAGDRSDWIKAAKRAGYSVVRVSVSEEVER